MRLHPRHRIDIGLAELAFAAAATLRPLRRRALASEVEACWSPGGDTLACLSARSGFDLLLCALGLPVGSEILVSAVTIPDMVRIVADHGLVAVPVDLDPDTLGPRPDLLERLRTPRTRAVLVAHLFGGRLDLGPAADFARRHRLLLVEDCAQAFAGDVGGHDDGADASLFSFGPIKTATALGGGLVQVRDLALLHRMRLLHDSWPVQGRPVYARRVARTGALVALQRPAAYGFVATIGAAVGKDLDDLTGGAARSFPRGRNFRLQPPAPLLAVLHHRLRRRDRGRIGARAVRGEHVARTLGSDVELPGLAQPRRTHWLFPIAVEDPPTLVRRLRAAGFDASTATTALVAVPAPEGRPDADPVAARRLLERIVFLPVYPELPERELVRLMDACPCESRPERSEFGHACHR
jgi:dTDP-4-amino-4,6-dideoxygalactose transaminase